jgi:uncharacterized protein YdeI (BOF family)
MKMLVAATALAVAAAVPAFGLVQPAKAQSYSNGQTTTTKAKKVKKAKKTKTEQRVVRRSPYSSNPDYDVYVNGVYVGSDPDPRIRWSLKREYCQESVDGCGY